MTEVAPPDVILLRSSEEPDPYVEAFGEHGFRAICRPVLSFAFPADQILRERLQDRSRYGGIIATSPRAARALRRVFDADGTLHTEWEGTPAYVVGPKTADRFRALSFDVRGEESGNAETLAQVIAEEGSSKPLLFLAGNRRRETLPKGLASSGIPFEEEVVYETRPRTDLSLPPPDDGTWIVFFSPSGLKALQHSGEGAISEYRIAAIGPTTASEVESAGFTVDAVADIPSPESLAEAVVATSANRP